MRHNQIIANSNWHWVAGRAMKLKKSITKKLQCSLKKRWKRAGYCRYRAYRPMQLEEMGMLMLFDILEKWVYKGECLAIQFFKAELCHERWLSIIHQRAKNIIVIFIHEWTCHSWSLVIYISHHCMEFVDALDPNIIQCVDITLVCI